jgi:ABC-type branched-subunit amino acid transport system ATPase component
MQITKLLLKKFKRINEVEINLSSVNVLVGGNNAGKSSVLQGIHFSVIAAIASREAGKDTFTQDTLLYCPARNFAELRHGLSYLNQSQFGNLKLHAQFPDATEAQYDVRIYRGRNEGNVGCQRKGDARIGAMVASSENLFSIYVPGLAGVSQFEQFRTESVVRRSVASGDANLYLRNVLLLIKQKNKLTVLTERMRALFPGFSIQLKFEPHIDVEIDARISTTGLTGRYCPVELVGTGILQALQIFSYVTLFEPRLLLLDEPDSHLHPDNQGLLASALRFIASETSTQIIVSTHSRHLVDGLYDDANLVWLKDGQVFEQGIGLARLPFLLDIGALDNFDKLMAGTIEWVFLSEDTDLSLLKILAECSGFSMAETLFFSYKTSSNLESAKILASFIQEISPETKVIIHRDRDFMTKAEVLTVSDKISDCGAIPFITGCSDIEAYFIRPGHISSSIDVPLEEVHGWLDEISMANHPKLQHMFTRKRDEVKSLLYRNNIAECPDTLEILGLDMPLPRSKRQGKFMFKKVRAGIHGRFGTVNSLLTPTEALKSKRLLAIRAQVEQ